MVCKRLLKTVFAAVLVVFSCLVPSVLAAENIGTVPYLLMATSDQNSLYQQCTLGNAAADALKKYLNTDIAIVNGGDLIGNLPPGEVTADDLNACIRTDRPLAVCEISGAQLFEILETAISHVVLNENREYDISASKHDAFPQISGFRLSYNPGGNPGERISRLTYNDKPVQAEDRFTLAATVHMLTGGYGLPSVEKYTETSETLDSVMRRYIRDGMEDYSMPQKRINAMEVHSQQFLSRYSIFTIVIVCVILFALLTPITKRKINILHGKKEEEE